jgi:hypothetical protein
MDSAGSAGRSKRVQREKGDHLKKGFWVENLPAYGTGDRERFDFRPKNRGWVYSKYSLYIIRNVY